VLLVTMLDEVSTSICAEVNTTGLCRQSYDKVPLESTSDLLVPDAAPNTPTKRPSSASVPLAVRLPGSSTSGAAMWSAIRSFSHMQSSRWMGLSSCTLMLQRYFITSHEQ